MVLTRSTEGLSAPLASLLHAISVSNNLSDFCCLGELSATSWVEVFYSSLPTPARELQWTQTSADPICVLEQVVVVETTSSVWKTDIITVIRYLHFIISFLFLTYILQQKFHRKSNSYYGGKWQNRTAMSRATTCRFSISLTTHIQGTFCIRIRTVQISFREKLLTINCLHCCCMCLFIYLFYFITNRSVGGFLIVC